MNINGEIIANLEAAPPVKKYLQAVKEGSHFQ